MPGTAIIVEDAICAVEMAALKGECADAVRSDADEVVEDNSRRGVMCPEVILAEELFLVLLLVFLLETLYSLSIAMAAHIASKVTVGMRAIECIRNKNPR